MIEFGPDGETRITLENGTILRGVCLDVGPLHSMTQHLNTGKLELYFGGLGITLHENSDVQRPGRHPPPDRVVFSGRKTCGEGSFDPIYVG